MLLSKLDCYGFTVRGYIINLNNDTIHGLIQLSKFDKQTGNYIINGIDENSLKYMIGFQSENERKNKIYFSEMLLGYGFTYKETKYKFERKELVANNKNRSKNKRYLFVRI